jgi:hypothetical protein
VGSRPRTHRKARCVVSVFSAQANNRVVKIMHSGSEVVS